MKSEFAFPLASSTWGAEEEEEILSVLRSDKLTYGPRVSGFEAEAAHHFGSKFAVMVNSGSSANLLALASILEARGIPRNPQSEIIVTAVSWATTYFPISQLGFKIRLVDVNSNTLNSGIQEITANINEHTIGIFAVNLLGNPTELPELRKLADERGLFLLEDNCESMGASIGGKFTGTFGHVGSFSTYFSHHISTIEGGFCLTDDEVLYEFMHSMRSHGWIRGLPDKNHVLNRGHSFQDPFLFALPGFNLRPMEFQGAVGSSQLRKLPQFVEMRRRNAARFLSMAEEIPWLMVQTEVGQSSWFGFSIVLRDESPVTRDAIITTLEEGGVQTRPVVAGNIARHPVIQRLNIANPEESFPNSDRVHERGFFVGNHHFDLEMELELLFSLLAKLPHS